MKPFRFSLQAVLTVRANEERKALEAFAHARAELEKIIARQRLIHAEIEELMSLQRAVLTRTSSADELQRMQHGLKALQYTMQQCTLERQKAQTLLDEKSGALLIARQKREVVEKIHEKQLALHAAHVERLERRIVDDFAAMKTLGRTAIKWR